MQFLAQPFATGGNSGPFAQVREPEIWRNQIAMTSGSILPGHGLTSCAVLAVTIGLSDTDSSESDAEIGRTSRQLV
jgi:hypothetical protein